MYDINVLKALNHAALRDHARKHGTEIPLETRNPSEPIDISSLLGAAGAGKTAMYDLDLFAVFGRDSEETRPILAGGSQLPIITNRSGADSVVEQMEADFPEVSFWVEPVGALDEGGADLLDSID